VCGLILARNLTDREMPDFGFGACYVLHITLLHSVQRWQNDDDRGNLILLLNLVYSRNLLS